MRRILFAALLSTSTAAAGQHYETITQTDEDGHSTAIDLDSIQHDGDVRHFALLMTNKDGGHSVSREAINCRDRSFRIEDSSVYDKDGNLIHHWTINDTPTDIEEGTEAEDYLYVVCR